MINRYSKYGVLQGQQIDETAFNVRVDMLETGLTQLGRSMALNGATNMPIWFPIYVRTSDLTPLCST